MIKVDDVVINGAPAQLPSTIQLRELSCYKHAELNLVLPGHQHENGPKTPKDIIGLGRFIVKLAEKIRYIEYENYDPWGLTCTAIDQTTG